MKNGFTVYIYTNPNFKGCANSGISENFTQALWISSPDANAPEMYEGEGLPKIQLVKGNLKGTIKAVPCDDSGTPLKNTMMGGAYIACSDSRFSEACEKIAGGRFYGAVALHDRVEF